MGIAKDGMRGLVMFIAEIRNCRSKEEELKRVNKEFSNIRDKFSNSRTLTPYNKRKYLSKLLFVFLLGYDVDFGYMEAVSLILSNKFIDKKIAFLFLSIMIGPEHSALKVIRKSIKSELESTDPVFRSVALEAITNMACPEMAKEFSYLVLQVLISAGSDDSNKQCAAICLLTLFRVNSEELNHLTSNEEWRSQLIQLLHHSNLSLMSAAVSLLTFLSNADPSSYTGVVSAATSRLVKIIDSGSDQLPDLKYYQVTAPFITVKLLQLLQTQPDLRSSETELKLIITRINEQALSQRSRKSQHINAKHALFFECANLCVHSGMVDMCLLYLTHLMDLLTWEQANYRHCAMVILTSMTSIPLVFEKIKSSRQVIVNLLKTEPDNSVKRTAISLLCAMCTRSDVTQIVKELIDYLKIASFDIREDLVLKIPVLCEQFISDSKWYVETILSLMISDGDLVGDQICNRVINMIMTKSDLQKYAVNILFDALGSNTLHDNLVMMCAYVIGEYGQLSSVEPNKLLLSLHGKFFLCSRRTQYLMLSAYAKLCNLFPQLSSDVLSIFADKNIWCSSDVELQKRAVEYVMIIKSLNNQLISDVFDEMPPHVRTEQDNSSVHSLFEENVENTEMALFNSPTPSPKCSEELMDSMTILKHFLTNDSGLIFDGNNLSVSLQVHKNSQQPTTILVSLTVASKGSAIDQIDISTSEYTTASPVKIEIAPSSNSVPPWGQTTYQLKIACITAFTTPLPQIKIEYQCNSKSVKVPLSLPFTIGKFVVNQEVDATLFSNRWSRIHDDNQFRKVLMANSNGYLLFSELGKFGIIHLPRIDPNQNNFVGSGVFYSLNQCIGILMRIEPIEGHLSNKIRITAKFTVPNAQLFNELCNLIEVL